MLSLVKAPETRYAESGDIRLAYQVTGPGARDIVLITRTYEPIDLLWDDPLAARGLRRLASMGRLIACDPRGYGSSDSVSTETMPALQAWTDDVGVVMDAAGSEQAALVASAEAGLIAILFAATYPERVSALVLINPFSRYRRGADHPWGMPAEAAERYLDLLAETTGRGPIADLVAPSRASEPTFRRWFTRCERLSAGPQTTTRVYGLFQTSDVTAVLPSVRAPTLLVRRSGDRHVREGHAQLLSERIPHANLVELPGDDHIWFAGDVEALFDRIEAFLTGARLPDSSGRKLATVLFTDIVGSTERAARLGDHAWRELLEAHDELVRGQVEGFRGRLVQTTGDGALATFDGPARAIHCAAGIRDAVKGLDLSVRAGLHTGEIELRGDDVAGLAVHIGARVAALAEADEILVSGSVPPLVAGSGIRFRGRGRHALKGVPDEWDVLSVESGA
jgi:class 3 adenylate cyclase